MKRHLRSLPILLMVLLAISCSKNDSSSGPGDTTGDDFTYGTARTYPVTGTAAVSVQDTISGATFIVTPDGSEILKVSPVTGGPETPFAGTTFHVEYTGDGPVTLRIPGNPATEDVVLMQWSGYEGMVVDDTTDDTAWLGVPPSGEGTGYVEFTIEAQPVATSKRTVRQAASNNFAISKVASGTGDFNHLRAIYQTVNQVIDTWIGNLPAGAQTAARAKVDALPWTVMWTSGGNYYKHVTNAIFSPKVILYFNTNAQTMSIAHETGHYLCHALIGNARYNELYSRFPSDFWGGAVAHDLGSYREGRLEMLEDYPYITMFLIEGDVDQYDPTSVAKYNNVRDMMDNADPATRDYPSHEAFAACMLASLLRGSDTIYSFYAAGGGEKVKVPVVGASWGDVLTILGKGPRDPNELRSFIQDYLDSRGSDHRFKLPAMMEPLGWSYHGSGTVVDKEGKGIAEATVQCISQTGSGEYRTYESLKTGANGKFDIIRLFPGTNILRVYTNSGKDSTDFAYTADWAKPTTEAIDLGKLTIEQETTSYPLTFNYSYTLTPGIRAQNGLQVTIGGDVTAPEDAFVFPQTTSSQVDIQASAKLSQEIDISAQVQFSLHKGAQWTTSLNPGDYGEAANTRTTLSNGRLKLIEYTGPNSDMTETSHSLGTLNITIPGPTESGNWYRADVRLEWDYLQEYLGNDGSVVGSATGTTGAYIIHIYRDVSGSWWKVAKE